MTNTPYEIRDTATERPLVTFAIFAYNQEEYIREAVEGAFQQTYEPLEIILSDDCSSDRTYQIMQEMTAAYDGPHEVRAQRNSVNLGVTGHVFFRGREARGEIIIVAAGDDISKPERTGKLVDSISKNEKILAVCSKFDLISEDGAVLQTSSSIPLGASENATAVNFLKPKELKYERFQGSTAAYRKEVFNFGIPNHRMSFSEDNLLYFLIYCNGGEVAKCDLSLILYRVHEKALSNRGLSKRSILNAEQDSISHAKRNIDKMNTFLWIRSRCENSEIISIEDINACLRDNKIIATWPEKSLPSRVLSIVCDAIALRQSLLKWRLARIVGSPLSYQPKSIISKFQSRYSKR